MKIKFFLSDNNKAPTTISGYQFANAVANRGYNVEIVIDYNRKKQILKNLDADIIIFQKKIYPGHTYEDIKAVKGKIFLVHIDDDFVGVSEEYYLKTLRITDLILVGNRIHAEKMIKYVTTPVEDITSISDFENYKYVGIDNKNNSPLVISWQQNLADAYVEDLRLVSKPLAEIYKKYDIELRLYGWHEGKDYGFPDNRKIVQEFLPFAKYISFQNHDIYLNTIVPEIASSDIGIIPYIPIEERYGKSGFGLRKMMMMGVPMVTSNFGINKDMLQDGVSGFLASSDEEWYDKLEKLILDRALRDKFARNSLSFIQEEYSYDMTVTKFIEAIKKHFELKI